MTFYTSKPSPSIPPSYASKSPSGTENMAEGPYDRNRRTPYGQELDDLGGRGGSNDGPSSGHEDREGWKNGADNYFQHRPAPHPHVAKMYRFFCCGSRGGCAAWVVFILLFIVGLIVGLFFLAHKQASKAVLPIQESALPSANTSTTTITMTPSPIISPTPPPPSTFITVSISTYSPSPPSTVTETAEATTTATEIETTQLVSTATTVLSGTTITTTATDTETETEIQTTTAISVSATTQPTTIFTTLVTTVTTTPPPSVTTQTYTPSEPSTVTATVTDTSVTTLSAANRQETTSSNRINTITLKTTIYPSTTTSFTTTTVEAVGHSLTRPSVRVAPPPEIEIGSSTASKSSEGPRNTEKCPHNVGALIC